jgi:hypothetical protein
MTASHDDQAASTKSSSRRALLVGALGGIGAVAAGAMNKVSPVRAQGEAMVVGGTYNDATTATILGNQSNVATVFLGQSTAGGVGVYGYSNTNFGVRGESVSGAGVRGVSTSSIGVYGDSTTSVGVHGGSVSAAGVQGVSNSSIGVYGYSSNNVGVRGYNNAADQPAVVAWSGAGSTGLIGTSGGTVPPAKPNTGVYGYASQDNTSRGVIGESPAGQGVRGETDTGVALHGSANNGYALRTSGRLKADKVSGVKTINAGLTSVTLNPGVKIRSSSFVLLTPRVKLGGRDLWYTTNSSAGTITIHLSATRTSATKIAWLLLG